MAGGGVIGGASAAGLALSPGMVGLLLLAAFGVYYMADNEDAIGRSLEVVLEAEATNTELSLAAQAEYAAALTSWWESAKAGAIDLVSAPTWIQDVITGWASGFYEGGSISSTSVVSLFSLAAGSKVFNENGNPCAWTAPSVVFAYSSSASVTGVSLMFAFTEPNVEPLFINSSGNVVPVIVSSYKVDGNTFYLYTMTHASAQYSTQVFPDGYSLDTLAYAMVTGQFVGDEVTVAVYPDVIIGGISDQLSSGIGMDVIGLPDIVIPGPDVLPVNPSEGQTTAQAVTDYLMAALIAGEITWEQYWHLIGVYNPAIGSSVPTVGTVDPVTGTITNTEISTGVVVTPSPIQNFHVDLTSFFPFCIPFDLYEFVRILCAEPEAPVFHWEVQDLSGNVYSVDVDLSPWNPHAQLFRDAQCLLFIIGLLMLTRKFIKW